MAEDPKPAGRARTTGAAQHQPAEAPPLMADPAMAPITANTPLPPLTPLPLASQAAGGPTPQPPPAPWPQEAMTEPALAPAGPSSNPGGGAPPARAGSSNDRGINTTLAIGTLFTMLFVSLILLVVLAVTAANVSKSVGVLIWTMLLIIVANVIYALVIWRLIRPESWAALSLSFLRPRRGP